MKKLVKFSLSLLMCITLSISAIASNVVNEDKIDFTPEEIAEQIQIDNRLRAMSEVFLPKPMLRARVAFEVSIPQYQQINTYYCGPACVQMVYEGVTKDSSHDQQWFAQQLGTTTAGTSSDQIATALTRLTGGNYSVANVLSSNQDVLDVYYNIANSLEQGYPVVANIKEIPGRYSVGSGHFIAVYGSMIETIDTLLYSYVDPHYNADYYGRWYISGSDMLSALSSNAGNYVRVA